MTTLLHHVALPIASLGLFALCYSADAGDQQSEILKGTYPLREQSMDRPLNLGGDRQSSSYSDHKVAWKQVSGEIERIKKVAVRGKGEEHLAVLLTTEQGRRIVVDLGLTKQFRDVELRTGDRIEARGPVGRVNDRRVIFARDINVDGEIIRINRAMPAQHSSRSPKEVSGKIAIIKELKVKGGDQLHQVIRILTKDGRQVVADLGKQASIKGINLEYGHEITVEGPMARLSGKPFVLAQKVNSQGKTVRIEREFQSAMPAGRPGQGESARADSKSRGASGEVVVKGQVLNIDRDGIYVVRDPSGQEVHLLVAEDLNSLLHIGDHIEAQVGPDGSVTSISRLHDTQPESPEQ